MVGIQKKPKEESFHCPFLLTNGTAPEETCGVYIQANVWEYINNEIISEAT